ncbi:MAG: GNAT family N-acetyltransferase [Candidatus Eremiobacteraeota bacterium]|nr:GNAT family N-acetyltransferase [Candidatus Eremiobacteraeota bacterium]
MIYSNSIEDVKVENLTGFFIGWPNPPSSQVLLNILKNSGYFVVAIDDENNRVVGFITCLTDNVLTVYIPLLEVLPEYQKLGIGSELIRSVFKKFSNIYEIDLCCDEELQDYYSRFGMKKSYGMTLMKYEYQSGEARGDYAGVREDMEE